MNKVLYIPGFDKNLLSARKLLEHGNRIVLDSTGGSIQKESTQDKIQLKHGEHNMLYLHGMRIDKEGKPLTDSFNEAIAHTPTKMPTIQTPTLIEATEDEIDNGASNKSHDDRRDETPTTSKAT